MDQPLAVIVEQENDGRHVMMELLRDQGYVVRAFSSVSAVSNEWKFIRNARFFAIGGDVPGDGLKVLRVVRKDEHTSDAKALFILDDSGEERAKAVLSLKPDAVLLRPYSTADMQKRIDALVA